MSSIPSADHEAARAALHAWLLELFMGLADEHWRVAEQCWAAAKRYA